MNRSNQQCSLFDDCKTPEEIAQKADRLIDEAVFTNNQSLIDIVIDRVSSEIIPALRNLG